ncbi:hypothetical protein RJ55_08283 [Drechmeria coniospora]|nr:hypothetical protein RJ55_08283 [Drechmeria coniospora]
MLAAGRLRCSLPSSAMASAYSAYHGAASGSHFTVTALGRWSSINKPLPPVEKIKTLHVYDFDNTLFKTPMPNPAVWAGPTIGMLASPDAIASGGWWHDSRILAATGRGLDEEEPRDWEGWWNDTVLELVKLSLKQPDALCVLLTGRSEHSFADLVKRMVASQKLDFHIISLKPKVSPTNQKFGSTMHFKQLFLNALVETYKQASSIKVYEDRPKHTRGFRDFFAEYNRRQVFSPTRGQISAEVVQVADKSTTLDPVVEVAEVQNMLNLHNRELEKPESDGRHKRLRIKKTVFFTSYVINPDDGRKMRQLVDIPADIPHQHLKHHANSILICPRPCPEGILAKVGGMGSKLLWEVTGTACLDNSIWAVRVRPVPSTAAYHTDNPIPLVVLALRKGAKPIDAGKITRWDPVPPGNSFVFETTVGERVLLRVEKDDPQEGEYESLFANRSTKRKHAGDDDWAPRNAHGPHGGRNESRGYHTGRGGRGRGVSHRGHRNYPRGGGRGGRGRGGFQGYRSLDDVDRKNDAGAYSSYVNYDDAFPPLNEAPAPPQAHGSFNQGSADGRAPARNAGGNSADLQTYY